MKLYVDELTEYFEYLDTLRESGVTNMFGAAPYLSENFDLDKGKAKKVLSYWMNSFGLDGSPRERALGLEKKLNSEMDL